MNDLVPICIVGILTWGTYRLFELFARRKERMAIIEKWISSSEIEKALNLPLFTKPDNSSWALKISLLMIGIGLGAIIAFFIQYGLLGNLLTASFEDHRVYENIRNAKEIIYFSCIAVFGGVGLLSAYLIERKNSK